MCPYYPQVLREMTNFMKITNDHFLYIFQCHFKLEQALEEQHRSLEATLEELKQYKKQHEEWSELLNKILSEQASLETRIESKLEYENLKSMQNKKNGKMAENCVQFKENGKTYVTCSLPNDDLNKEFWKKIDPSELKKLDLSNLLKQFEHNKSKYFFF